MNIESTRQCFDMQFFQMAKNEEATASSYLNVATALATREASD